MKQSMLHPLFMLLLPVLFASSFAVEKSAADPAKPYLVVTPPKPIAGKDSVVINIILGTASNSCMAPTFSGCSFKIEQSPLAIYPPIFTVRVKFTEVPIPKDKVCPMVYNPVDYGPVFGLGRLALGVYHVVKDGADETAGTVTYGTFSVYESNQPSGHTIKGTVRDDPFPLKRASMPVAKAKIYLYSGAIPLSESQQDAASGIALPRISDSAATDQNGNYSFTNVATGSYNLVCKHPDYRTVSLPAIIRNDTVIDFTLVPADAYASVTGQVTLIKSDALRQVPVQGCTVTVEKASPVPILPPEADISTGASSILRAITDSEGRYTINKIPITANGEIWRVYSLHKGNTAMKLVALYNMRTDTVNLTFSVPYENSASKNIDGIVFTTAADKYVYQEKEPVRIRYSITNTTMTPKTFGPFSKGCEYDMIVMDMDEAKAYQTSPLLICIDLLSEITVKPYETVVHDFPDWYISNIKQRLAAETFAAPRSVTLKFAARLRGKEFDNTLLGVPVTIELEPPLGVASGSVNGSAATSFTSNRGLLTLNLDKPQTVNVAVYTLSGAIVPASATTRQLPRGMHTLSLRNIPAGRGLYLVKVRGREFEKRFIALRSGR